MKLKFTLLIVGRQAQTQTEDEPASVAKARLAQLKGACAQAGAA